MYMKKMIFNKKKICTAALLIASLTLTACSKPGENTNDIEKEVSQALGIEDTETEGTEEEADTEEPESALEYVDVEDPEVEQPDESIMTDSGLGDIQMEATEADDNGNTETTVSEEEDTLQIVFIGDSIFDAVRDETGIAYEVGSNLDADVYNLAIGGTTAGLRSDKSTDKATWNEPNLMGICYSMVGEAPEDLLSGYKAGEILKTCDFSKTDYFILDYGTNDFLWYIPLGTDDYQGRYYYYFRSAYNLGIEFLQEHYPNAKIILCTPYYEEFWSSDRTRYIGDAHSVNNGYGTLLDYISVVQDVAADYNLSCLNMYDLMGIDVNNVNDMTVDGIHPSEQARAKYAGLLIDEIKRLEDGGEPCITNAASLGGTTDEDTQTEDTSQDDSGQDETSSDDTQSDSSDSQ